MKEKTKLIGIKDILQSITWQYGWKTSVSFKGSVISVMHDFSKHDTVLNYLHYLHYYLHYLYYTLFRASHLSTHPLDALKLAVSSFFIYLFFLPNRLFSLEELIHIMESAKPVFLFLRVDVTKSAKVTINGKAGRRKKGMGIEIPFTITITFSGTN